MFRKQNSCFFQFPGKIRTLGTNDLNEVSDQVSGRSISIDVHTERKTPTDIGIIVHKKILSGSLSLHIKNYVTRLDKAQIVFIATLNGPTVITSDY